MCVRTKSIKKKLRKADSQQNAKVGHIEFLNLTVEPKHPTTSLVADYWQVAKKTRPKPVEKKKVISSPESSSSELSSEEEAEESDI